MWRKEKKCWTINRKKKKAQSIIFCWQYECAWCDYATFDESIFGSNQLWMKAEILCVFHKFHVQNMLVNKKWSKKLNLKRKSKCWSIYHLFTSPWWDDNKTTIMHVVIDNNHYSCDFS